MSGWRKLAVTYGCTFRCTELHCPNDAPYVSPSFGDGRFGDKHWDGEARCEEHREVLS